MGLKKMPIRSERSNTPTRCISTKFLIENEINFKKTVRCYTQHILRQKMSTFYIIYNTPAEKGRGDSFNSLAEVEAQCSRSNACAKRMNKNIWYTWEEVAKPDALDERIAELVEKKAKGQIWSQLAAKNAEVEASKSSDPIMSVREYLTMPKSQAEVFLQLWTQRQEDAGRASAQAQGLRLKAMLAVADGSQQNHPTE